MKRKKSIKTKVLLVLLIMQIPLMLIIIVYNIYFLNFFNSKISESNRNALKSYCTILEGNLERLDSRMLNFIAMDTNFIMLSRDTSYLDAHLHSLEIINYFNDQIEENELLYGCYIINHKYGILREAYGNDSVDYYVNEKLRTYFQAYIDKENSIMDAAWKPLKLGDNSFLYMIKGYRGTYAINIIDISSINMPQDDQSKTDDGSIILFSGADIYNGAEIIEENRIAFEGKDHYYFTGSPQKYLVIEQALDHSEIRGAYLMKYRGFMGSLSFSQRMTIILSVIIIILILPVGYCLLKRVFFKPIDCLVGTMDAVRAGKMETRADEEYSDIEFLEMNRTFNAMISEINELKIESYEKEINLQKTQLDYYQTQIRPHFYVNCLKSIYGMLEEERSSAAKNAVVYLSRHLRYMLKRPSLSVSMEEELTYVRNYIDLQDISMAYPPKLHIEIAEDLKQVQIPPISILSFVENCVKYGGKETQNLSIGIYINRMDTEDTSFINISISDNGPGFSEELLQKFNNYEKPEATGHSVGIYNVIQRFILFYGHDHVMFAFSNCGGAHVDIFIS